MSKTRLRQGGNSLRWSWCHGGTAAERNEHSEANSAPAAASGSLQSVRGDAAMQNKDDEVTPRYFNPTWAPTLSDEARKAVTTPLTRCPRGASRPPAITRKTASR